MEDLKTKEEIEEEERQIVRDKISSCHVAYHKGYDIDISIKQNIFICYEQTSGTFFFGKKYNMKSPSYIFINENYLYILQGTSSNENFPDLRRIKSKYDLYKLYDYNIESKDKNFEFSFDFIIDEDVSERKIKKVLFPEKDGDAFEDELLETLGKLDSVYLETEGEKEDNENGKDNIEDVFDSKIMGPFSSNIKRNQDKKNIHNSDSLKESFDSKTSSRIMLGKNSIFE